MHALAPAARRARPTRQSTTPAVAPAPQAPALRDLVGDSVLRAALDGAALDGMGPYLADALRLTAAGVSDAPLSLPAPPAVAGPHDAAALDAAASALGADAFRAPGGAAAVDEGAATAAIRRSPGAPLPAAIEARFSAALGHDLSHVRLHADAAAAQAAEALNARAFALGADLFFGANQLAPGTVAGDRLLAHELTHVIQHDEGRLPTPAGGGLEVSSPSDPAEREAVAAEQRIDGALTAADATAPSAATQEIAAPAGVAHRSALGDAVEAGVDAAVRAVSPDLADLLAEGLEPIVERLLGESVTAAMLALTGVDDLDAAVAALSGRADALTAQLAAAAAGDPAACETVAAALEGLSDLLEELVEGPIGAAIVSGLSGLDGVLGAVFGGLLEGGVDTLLSLVGADDPSTGLGAFMAAVEAGWAALQELAGGVAEQLMNALGLPVGEAGPLAALAEHATALTEAALAQGADAIALGQATLSLLLAVVAPATTLVDVAGDVAAAVSFVWEHLGDPELAVAAHEELGGTMLPAAVDAVAAIGAALNGALAAAGPLGESAGSLAELGLALAETVAFGPVFGLMGRLGELIDGLVQGVGFDDLSAVVGAAFDHLADGLGATGGALLTLGRLALTPAALPWVVTGALWLAVPCCVRAAIVDFTLGAAVLLVEALELPALDPWWAMLKAPVAGVLAALVAAPEDEQLGAVDRLAAIAVSGVDGVAFLAGLLAGAVGGAAGEAQGLAALAYAISTLPLTLGTWSASLLDGAHDAVAESDLAAAAAHVGPFIEELGGVAGQTGDAVVAFLGGAVEALASLTADDLLSLDSAVQDALAAGIASAAGTCATALLEALAGDGGAWEAGQLVGAVAGAVLFELAMDALTAGVYEPASAFGKALAEVADLLNLGNVAVDELAALLLKGADAGVKAAADLVEKLPGALGTLGAPLAELAAAIADILRRLADALLCGTESAAPGSVGEIAADKATDAVIDGALGGYDPREGPAEAVAGAIEDGVKDGIARVAQGHDLGGAVPAEH